MIKILLGGSPCTNWSIAKTDGRETEPSGIGWELFKNYIIAKEKFAPDIFLYENVASASPLIKEAISDHLGVDLITINSALVSAQNRKRIYGTGAAVEQPEDRGIYLREVLESGLAIREKSYCLDANYYKGGGEMGFDCQAGCRRMVAEPVVLNDIDGKARTVRATCYKDGIRNLVANNVDKRTCVAEHDSKQYRVYSPDGKSTTLCAEGGGMGAKTGLYAIPIETPAILRYERTDEGKQRRKAYESGEIKHGFNEFRELHPRSDGKSNALTTVQKDNMVIERTDSVTKPIYEVRDGYITIKGKQYPIKLADGYYIIRKLTVTECCRLQTMPDDYCRAVSNTQAYRGLGNGWTAEVIIHILRGQLASVPRDEKLQVLSMYDGIGTGLYCLKKMGFTNIEYHAYEIDKYAMQVAMSNHPEIVQHGDAFAVRDGMMLAV